MERAVLFVDAGHVLAEGGNLCCGTKRRGELACDYAGLILALISLVGEHSGVELLRVYWYDGARDAIPTPDHLSIAHLPNTKLRLGRVSGNRQKGVDALVVRDMMKLAGAQAMTSAFLLAGDEDLRIGVTEAQELGVRVVLLGIPVVGEGRYNQADSLIRECDEHVMLERSFLETYLKRLPRPAIAVAPEPASPRTAGGGAEDARELGAQFGQDWVRRAAPAEIHGLWGKHPRIPQEIDSQLLKHAEARLGVVRGRDDVRRLLRKGFWSEIERGVVRIGPPAREGV